MLSELFLACDRELKDKKCIYVQKEPVLFDGTLIENITMGEEIDSTRIERVLEKTALVEDIRTFEDGLSKRCGKKGENLSGGQRKRVGIARALYRNVDILFLDGITDRVDSVTADFLRDNVLSEFHGVVFDCTG